MGGICGNVNRQATQYTISYTMTKLAKNTEVRRVVAKYLIYNSKP